MQKLFNYIFLIFCSSIIYPNSFIEVFKAKDVIGMGKNYQNPEWSLDSKAFTVEMHMDSSKAKIFKLFLGEIKDQIQFSALISDTFKKKSSKLGKSKKVRERNLGWVADDEFPRFYGTLDVSDKIRDCYLRENNLDIDPISEFEDQDLIDIEDLEVYFPMREYTISDSSIYFTTYSDAKRIWTFNHHDTDVFDQFTYSVLAYKNSEDKIVDKFDIPIVSLSSSKNENEMLLVSYNENQSEIIYLEKGNNYDPDSDIKCYDRRIINKPVQENMNYLYGILDPKDSNRYLLIARNQISANSENKNLAKVFVMNDSDNDNIEGEFTMYRSMEMVVLYNNPEIQFHPITSDIYYIVDDINQNKKIAYWDGKKSNLLSLDLDNIKNFKFSPDGKYLLATTFEPSDLYIYEIIK